MKQSKYLDYLIHNSHIKKPIDPDNIYKLIWDFLIFFILIIDIFYTPLSISFDWLNTDSYIGIFS